jgi:hypothetical protein
MKLFLVHTMVFVGSIWKIKSGWFPIDVPGVVSGHRNCADCWGPSLIFNPSFAQNQPRTTPQITDPMKLFLVHTIVFVGSIWKNKSGWFPFVLSLGLSVATEIVLTAGVNH